MGRGRLDIEMDSSRRAFLAGLAGLAALPAAARAASPIAARAPRRPVRLAANENPFGPSPLALAAAERSLLDAHRYPAARAHDELRASVARRNGVPESCVLLGAGSHECIRLAAGAFAGSTRRRVVLPELAFEALVRYSAPFAPATLRVPLESDFSLPADRILAAVGESPALVYLANPASPTGLALAGGEVETLARGLPEGSTLLLDEAYLDFADDPKVTSGAALLAKGLPVVVTGTFSKLHGLASMRVGWALASAENAATMEAFRTSLGISGPALAAAAASLDDAAFRSRSLERIGRGRERLRTGLEAMGLKSLPSQGNFVFFDWGKPAGALVEALWSAEIEVPPPHPKAPTWVRVSVGTEDEIAEFLAELARIRTAGG